MTVHSVPNYELDELLALDGPEQFKALFDRTRLAIIDMLSERAATASELAEAMGRPKGTIGHHVGVLEKAGLIRVVRTEKVRAIEAKYYGRVARTFELSKMTEAGIQPGTVLSDAVAEMWTARQQLPDHDLPGMSSVRHARIPAERAREWSERLAALVTEFAATPRGGDTVYGLIVGLYPTIRPHLRDPEDASAVDR
jgi:DNA-binding transcriptional ArsR family regulator